MNHESTIAAASTPQGTSGVAVVRMSGPESIEILSRCWRGHDPKNFKSHTLHLGWIIDAEGKEIDQVVASLFSGPNSYTGEDTVELSCHGSPWIVQHIIHRLLECGATAASAGEFTRRAFMNGRLDLAQAEGVADMIAASSAAAARLAASQMKGTFSQRLEEMRQKLIDLGTLLELELDFSEEEVEFADRQKLITLSKDICETVNKLASSFKAGKAFKAGIPVAIAGIPNAGKSTLLNCLLEEEKAIVSDIPGTTRDVIEDAVEIDGILFRFYDTAGLRDSDDTVENIGIERARQKISEAAIILHLIDPTQPSGRQNDIIPLDTIQPDTKIIRVGTKADISADVMGEFRISANTGQGIEELKKQLVKFATADFNPNNDLIVTNARHFESLKTAGEALTRLIEGLESETVPADFLAQDLREATYHIGTITGTVTSTELLHTIFSRYCIGK